MDVYAASRGVLGKVYVTVKGEDVAENVYKTPIKSSVRTAAPTISTEPHVVVTMVLPLVTMVTVILGVLTCVQYCIVALISSS